MAQGAPAAALEIDDPIDHENAVLKKSLRRRKAFYIGKRAYVLGADRLPQRWAALAEPLTTKESASQFLGRAFDKAHVAKLRVLAKDVSNQVSSLPDAKLVDLLAESVSHGRVWIIAQKKQPPLEKADPAIFAALNAKYATRVNFVFLTKWEGGQRLHGYVPFSKGIVAEQSGVTIATGFDIGQKSAAEIKKLNFSMDVENRLLPFADTDLAGMTRAQVQSDLAKRHAPIPIVTKAQANEIDTKIHGLHLAAAVTNWNRDRKAGVPAFADLPVNWQTVLFSRTFHMGVGMHLTSTAHKFYTAATAGSWAMAADALRQFPVKEDWYVNRVHEEASYLETTFPPAVKDGPAGKPR